MVAAGFRKPEVLCIPQAQTLSPKTLNPKPYNPEPL